MRKIIKAIAGVTLAASFSTFAAAVAGCNENEDNTYTVNFVTYVAQGIDPVEVKEGEKLTAPTTPVSDYYDFVGWYTDASFNSRYEFANSVTGDMTLYAKWELKEPDFPEPDEEVKEIIYNGGTITLSENALYVNQNLTEEQTGTYAFASLEDCVASAKDGTKDNPVIIYLAPDVYWTDDPDDPEIRPADDLIGLEISQSYITLVGMTDSYEDTVIASNRGQNTGANGNYNTVGVGEGFSAYNVTFGNYCNIDLVYPRDTSKNREKRAGGIVQAQVITDATKAKSTDMRYYENCAFMSRLNTIATWNSIREVYVDCHIECTDDAVGTPEVGIYMDCSFDLYGQTPTGTGGKVLQAYLGCKFNTHFESYSDKSLNFCKNNTAGFAFIDCDFAGDMEKMTWLNPSTAMNEDIRNVVYNNTLNGKPLAIDEEHPYTSINLDGDSEAFTAFKVGNEYNVYNLVNYGDKEEWDPLAQKERMEDYLAPFEVRFITDGSTTITGDGETSLTITPVIYGYHQNSTVTWSTDNPDMVKLTPNKDGSLTIVAENMTFVDTDVCITATMDNGLEKVIHITVISPTLEAPSVVENSATIDIESGNANLTYTLSESAVDGELNPDNSVIDWYRSSLADGSGALHIATTTYVKDDSAPNKDYKLTESDIGNYLVAVITPKYKHSYTGESVKVLSQKITEDMIDVSSAGVYSTDFSDLAYEQATYADIAADDCTWTNNYVSGVWYGGYYRPAEYDEGGKYFDKQFYYVEGENAYVYELGTSGAAGVYGYSTNTQGARLVYIDDSERGDMSMTVTLSAVKTDGQGFGSAKQFMDIFFKYDQATMTGYGLRIIRVDSTEISQYPELAQYADLNSKSCMFQIMSYENGIATPLTDPQMLSCFLKDMTVKFDMTGNKLTCEVSTTSPQSPACAEVGMPHSYIFECEIEGEVNSFGGFGFQHTGTAGAGKSGNRTIIQSLEVDYKN